MKLKANDYTPEEIIKIIREWCEMTQEEFSEKVDITTGTLQNYEQGRRNYTFKKLIEVSKACGIVITIEKKR